MPVWLPAYEMSGIQGPIDSVLHFELAAEVGPDFLLSLGPLADIIPIPFWPVQNVASLGDLFLTAGLAFFLFATILRDTGGRPARDRGRAHGALRGAGRDAAPARHAPAGR